MVNARCEERPHNGCGHPSRSEQHAASCRIGMCEPLQAKDKQDRCEEIARLDVDVQFELPFLPVAFVGISRLNIRSIRSVIRNPPMTLIEAEITATKPSQVLTS